MRVLRVMDSVRSWEVARWVVSVGMVGLVETVLWGVLRAGGIGHVLCWGMER